MSVPMPAKPDATPALPGLSPICGKPIVARFDGGQLSSDGGILALRGIEQHLGVADRQAACVADPRDPDRVRHSIANIIRFRLLMIAAGYENGNDAASLRHDPAFKLALGGLSEGAALCSQPTISRPENLLMPARSSWRVAQFDTLRLRLLKIAACVVEWKTKVLVHLPSAGPDQAILRLVLDRLLRPVSSEPWGNGAPSEHCTATPSLAIRTPPPAPCAGAPRRAPITLRTPASATNPPTKAWGEFCGLNG